MKVTWIRTVFRRRVLVILVLLIQIAFMVFLITGTSRYFFYVDLLFRVVSITVSVYVLNKQKKPAFKFIWLFLIMLFPLFGGFMYIFFHTQVYSRKLGKLIKKAEKNTAPFFLLPGNRLPDFIKKEAEFEAQANYLQNYAGYPVYMNTVQEYFPSGETFFKRVLEELEKAERYIFMEFFILKQGVMLDSIIAILLEKAKQGLDIRVIYDDLGCFMSLPADYRNYLEENGIKCFVFNPFKPILSSLQNNRDHRKIISIDGKVAFTGGLNLADEYINAVERFGHWKDAAIMLKGEGAWSFTLIFLQMWSLRQKEKDDYEALYPWKESTCQIKSDGYVQPYADNPIDTENVGEHVYLQIINKAKKYLYINTPYLVVDDNLLSALTLSAKSGVDVRIITPYRWDKWYVAIASRSYYRQLIAAGVKVYEYSSGFNHGKTFVSDDRIATVGTSNLDFRSLYLHFECGVIVYRGSIIQDVKNDFLVTIPVSKTITEKDCARNVFQRIIPDVLRIFAPLM